MNCNVCGNEVKEGSSFCNNCGTSIKASPKSAIQKTVKTSDTPKVVDKEVTKPTERKSNQKRKSYSSRVMQRGRVTIPMQIREALSVKEEDYIVFSIEGDTITIVKAGKKIKP